jgi:phosphoglycolate phosphatase-like HAD superfamily hydrolase
LIGNIRTVILDFDGVLVESNPEKTEAFKALFSCYPEYEKEMLDYHHQWFSASRMKKFEYLVCELMNRPGDAECINAIAEKFSNLVMDRVISCPAVPGAMEFLTDFSRRIPIYISSTTPQIELEGIIRGRNMDRFVKAIYGDPPVKKKTAIRSIMKKENILPEEVLFIGDALSDYMVACECGIRFLGRDSGLSFQNHEVALYRDLFEIADLIRQEEGILPNGTPH